MKLQNVKPQCAHYKGTLNGKRYSEYVVIERVNSSRLCATIALNEYHVISDTPAHAIDHVRDERGWPAECEYMTYGPKGGETYRYTGWETAIGMAMVSLKSTRPGPTQLELNEVFK